MPFEIPITPQGAPLNTDGTQALPPEQLTFSHDINGNTAAFTFIDESSNVGFNTFQTGTIENPVQFTRQQLESLYALYHHNPSKLKEQSLEIYPLKKFIIMAVEYYHSLPNDRQTHIIAVANIEKAIEKYVKNELRTETRNKIKELIRQWTIEKAEEAPF